MTAERDAQRPLVCAAFSSAPGRLRLHYRVAGTVYGPNEVLAHIDVAESDDEVFVGIFEAVSPGDKHLAGVTQCVELPYELGERELRDANVPREDERRGARRYLLGTLVPRQPFEDVHLCHDWNGASWETRSGPQKWPHGTVYRRLLRPT